MIMRRKWIALIGIVVVGCILIIQMAQGEANTLHWIGLGAIGVALVTTLVDLRKGSRTLG